MNFASNLQFADFRVKKFATVYLLYIQNEEDDIYDEDYEDYDAGSTLDPTLTTTGENAPVETTVSKIEEDTTDEEEPGTESKTESEIDSFNFNRPSVTQTTRVQFIPTVPSR